MPKLNTTIDNLELKSNKVVSTSDPSTWTDAQYPSAKALLDIAHPVGSIITTATNENPASKLGGAWELVDKAFKGTYIPIDSSFWTPLKADIIGSNSSAILIDHSISLRLNFNNTTVLDDNAADIGTLDLTRCGVSKLSYGLSFDPIISDSGNCTMNYRITQDGVISIHEVLNIDGTHTMPTGSNFYINILQPVGHDNMLDSVCDKFYWKRTA